MPRAIPRTHVDPAVELSRRWELFLRIVSGAEKNYLPNTSISPVKLSVEGKKGLELVPGLSVSCDLPTSHMTSNDPQKVSRKAAVAFQEKLTEEIEALRQGKDTALRQALQAGGIQKLRFACKDQMRGRGVRVPKAKPPTILEVAL